MNNPWVFVFLMMICVAGLALGAYYYFYPQKIIIKRIKSHHLDIAKKDSEFRKWLDLEMQTQINRTRWIGMTMLVFEAIWLILIVGLWQRSLGH